MEIQTCIFWLKVGLKAEVAWIMLSWMTVFLVLSKLVTWWSFLHFSPFFLLPIFVLLVGCATRNMQWKIEEHITSLISIDAWNHHADPYFDLKRVPCGRSPFYLFNWILFTHNFLGIYFIFFILARGHLLIVNWWAGVC